MNIPSLSLIKRLESNKGATIVYATHIFDGLSKWPTHIVKVSKTGSLDVVDPKYTFLNINIIISSFFYDKIVLKTLLTPLNPSSPSHLSLQFGLFV